MSSTPRPDQVNRVKIITSKFEGLNGQNVEKSDVGKDFHLLKATGSRLRSDSCVDNYLIKNRVLNGNNSAKENFGPSCNFGNRKRLKDPVEKEVLRSTEEKINSKSFLFGVAPDVDSNLSKNSSSRILSRQYSDPVKKLQRKPAFRCDRSEKIREPRRSSSDRSPEPNRELEVPKGREKLKKLGSMIEERLREDNLTFSTGPTKNKDLIKFKTSVRDKCSDLNVLSRSSVSEENKSEVFGNMLFSDPSDEMKPNDNIPQHILDMYAKVLKPKSRSAFGKCDLIIKGDAVFSDSGVSSESENLISDDLEEAKNSNHSVFEKIVQNYEIIENIENVCANSNNLEIERPNATKNGNDLSSDSISMDEELFVSSKSALLAGDVSVDTLKKVLKEPLPLGPPPKKPPRIFASAPSDQNFPKKSPTKTGKILSDSKFKLKNFASNKIKPHRSREESKMMLDKIEDALKKHKNTGKILSPRLGNRIFQEQNLIESNRSRQAEDSFSTASTQPSSLRLRQPSKKSSKNEESAPSTQPKEVHYMCTELLDLPFLDKHSNVNVSDGSITSSEEVQPASYLSKCFNSLNCANAAGGAAYSAVFYSKFGSAPNSSSTSFVDACCYCNQRDKKCGEKSDSAARLSTFFNPNRSLDRADNAKCKRCGLNEKKGDNFKCHLDCKCIENAGNSLFFTRETQSASPSEPVKYGTLLKSKSQEHIYDEPINVIGKRRSADSPKSEVEMRSAFVRSATQLEDGFRKLNRCSLGNVHEPPDQEQFVRNDFKSKTMGRMPSGYKESKIKDLSKLWEIKKKKKADDCDIRISEDEDKKNLKSKPLHYMCSYIYDTPQPEEEDSNLKNGYDSKNTHREDSPNSKLRDNRSPVKKLTFLEKKLKEPSTSTAAQRPKHLELGNSSRAGLHARVRGIGPATDADKRNLDRLMTEIYDTVTAVCMIDSPTKDGKIVSGDILKNVESSDASQNSLILNEKEMSDASLKLTRSLTEKRKKYVRRVSSKVELYAPTYVSSTRRNNAVLSVKEKTERKKPDFTLSLPTKYDFEKLKAVFEQNKIFEKPSEIVVKSEMNTLEPVVIKCESRLFDACALVGMNFSTGQAYVKSVYPEHAALPPQIESLVFPESLESDNVNDSSQNNCKVKKIKCELIPEDAQTYSLVLTNEYGIRSYGYCRRVVPEGEPFCLPLAYCIITPYRVPAFFNLILKEIEFHHGSSEITVKSLLDQLYREDLPNPGSDLSIKLIKTPKKSSSIDSFKKNSTHRSSVNLGDVLNKFSYCDNNGNPTKNNLSDSMENNACGSKNLRRKSTDLSLKFPDVFPGENNLSVVRSLEKIYGEDFKNYQDSGFYIEMKRSALNLNESCFEREFENNKNLESLANIPFDTDISKNLEKAASSHKSENETKNIKKVDYYETPIKLLRPLEPRLEEDCLSVLFNSISVGALVKIFGSLLLERKVIVVSDKLSQLSSCIEGLQSILYPFIWQHTIIAIIPSYLRRDILDAPLPILAGILCTTEQIRKSVDGDNKHFSKEKSPKLDQNLNGCVDSKSNFYFNTENEIHSDLYEEIESSNFEEGMIIDISSKNNVPSDKILKYQGDESTLLPPVLSKKLRAALQLSPSISASAIKSDSPDRKTRNLLIAEAFLRFFVDLFGDYRDFVSIPISSDSPLKQNCDAEKQISFDKEQFIKNSSSKHVQFFLEWFTETALFNNFIKTKPHNSPEIIQEHMKIENTPYPGFYDLFDEKIKSKKQYAEAPRYSKYDSSSNGKNNYKLKIKTWRDKLRDLIN